MVTIGTIGPSGPSAFCEAPELVQPAGAIEALYEHSGVHAANTGQFFFVVLSLSHHDL